MTLKPYTDDGVSFAKSEAEASYCARDRRMYVSKAKSSFGQVEFSKLSEAEKVQFRASRKKELDSLVATSAVEILSVEDSLKFANETPEQIIDSKCVDRYKPIAVSKQKLEEYKTKALTQGHLQAIELEADATNPKSRLCAVGWQDPQVLEVERSSRTPLSTSFVCLSTTSCKQTLEDKGERCEDCILAVAADNEDKTSCLQTPKGRNSRRQLAAFEN